MKAILPLIFSLCVFSCLLNAQNNCLDFGGSSDIVTIGSHPNLSPNTNALTIEMWVYLTVLPDQVGGFVALYDSNEDSYILYEDGIEDELRFKVTDQDGTAERPGISSADLSLQTWHHIVGVYDGNAGEARIYLDGVLKDAHPNTDLTGTVKAGQIPTLGGQGQSLLFDGKMDELRIWDRALCAEEIMHRMNCELVGNEPGLFSYYNFNQGIADGDNTGINTLTDLAGGSDGSLLNFDLSGNTSNWVAGAGTLTSSCTPVFSVTGNGIIIENGDTSSSEENNTDLGSNDHKWFKINNGWGTDIIINDISLSGPDVAEFSHSGGSISGVAANSSSMFNVQFNPLGMGIKIVTVEIDYSICGTDFTHTFTVQKFSNTRTWDNGAGTNNWADAANWYPDGVPNNYEEAVIESGDVVTIDNQTYNLNLLRLDNNSGIINTGILNIDNAAERALYIIESNFVNSGTVNVDNSGRAGIYLDSGSFTNNGMIRITNLTSNQGINLYESNWVNNGSIDMDAVHVGVGLQKDDVFDNNAQISIRNSTSHGLYLTGNNSIFNNNAEGIFTAGNGHKGITTATVTTINNYGAITINQTSSVAATISGTLNNHGTFTTDQTSTSSVSVSGVLNNHTGASLTVKNILSFGGTALNLSGNQDFVNKGSILLENCGVAINGNVNFTNEGYIEVRNRPNSSGSWFYHDFTNAAGASMVFKNIDGNPIYFTDDDTKINNGLLRVENCKNGYQVLGDFTNNGRMEVEGTTNGRGMDIRKDFDNNGEINITGTFSRGIYYYSGARVNNNQSGEILISDGRNGLYGTSTDTEFHNFGLLNISDLSERGIYSDAEFVNHSTGIINIDITGEEGIYGFSQPILNQGQLTINNTTEEAIRTSNFSSTGDLRGSGDYDLGGTLAGNIAPGASPGKMNFLSDQTFTGNLKMEIGGSVPETEHDQITSTDIITLTGAVIDVTLLNGYVPPVGQTVNFTLVFSEQAIVGTPTINLPLDTPETAWQSTVTADAVIITSGAVLPVELIDFSLRLEERDKVVLDWQTATEINNAGFNIQHSRDGRTWENIGFEEGAGTTDLPQAYSFTHGAALPGANYYRLQQKDFDGTTAYSEVLSVNVETVEGADVAVYPNPCSSDLFLKDYTGTFEIIDTQGRLHLSGVITTDHESIKVADLPEGFYFVKLIGQDRMPVVKKIYKQI